MNERCKTWLLSSLITLALLMLAFGTAMIVDTFFEAQPLIPLFFVLAVFWVSQLTDGYFWGIFSSLFSVLAVNFVFTYPFLAFDFEVVENAVSAAIILAVSISTCTLTQRLKHHEMLHREFDQEKMRGNLLRAVSHDLRTPLTGIYGATSTIVENYDMLSDEDKLQMLKGIQEDSQWLISMVENLLSITKMDNEHVQLTRVPVVVEELIGSVLAKFQRRYADQPVDLQLPEEFITISVDPILIEQVLVNLLENAVQHALGMKRLQLKVYTRDNVVFFEVIDDGCGISRERFSQIFSGTLNIQTPDNQKHNMGIGLSVCASIIKAHEGSIYVHANKPRGSCFGFRLAAEEVIHE